MSSYITIKFPQTSRKCHQTALYSADTFLCFNVHNRHTWLYMYTCTKCVQWHTQYAYNMTGCQLGLGPSVLHSATYSYIRYGLWCTKEVKWTKIHDRQKERDRKTL